MASRAPATTALRHIARLERQALVRRRPDLKDNRVTHLELTEEAQEKLNNLMNELMGVSKND